MKKTIFSFSYWKFRERIILQKLKFIAVLMVVFYAFVEPSFAGRPPGMTPILLGTFSVQNGVTSVPLSGGHAGDTVYVDAQLFTNDPNEDGENEPLNIASGSGGGSVSQYFSPTRISFTMVRDSQMLDAGIQGADYDESATFNLTIDPAPPKPTYTEEEKKSFSNLADTEELIASGIDVSVAACESLRATCSRQLLIALKALGMSASLEANYYKALALDPSDPNFQVIAKPIIPSLPVVTAEPGFTQAEADAVNALLNDSESSIGITKAILTSIDRVLGAYDANNDIWETKQRNAIALYNLQLSDLVQHKIKTLSALQAALSFEGLSIPISSTDAFYFELNLLQNGLPPSDVSILTKLLADPVTINNIKNRLSVLDINKVAGTFPDLLVKPSFIDSINKAATSLTEAAINTGKPLELGQHVEGGGVINGTAGNGNGIDFEFNAHLNNKQNSSTLTGELELKDHFSGFEINKSVVSRVVLIDKVVVMDGTYNANDGSTGAFRVVAADNASAGKGSDTFSISLSNGYRANGVLTGGNIVVKNKRLTTQPEK
jgi:hypothetical protein